MLNQYIIYYICSHFGTVHKIWFGERDFTKYEQDCVDDEGDEYKMFNLGDYRDKIKNSESIVCLM